MQRKVSADGAAVTGSNRRWNAKTKSSAVTEGGFSVLFQGLFPPAHLGCAMILSRLASFYVPLVVSGLGFLTMKNDAN